MESNEKKDEELTVINGRHYLHLQEKGDGYDYKVYDVRTGLRECSGHITGDAIAASPVRGRRAAARRLAIDQFSPNEFTGIAIALGTLSKVADARRAWRKEHANDPHAHSIRFITSRYDELYRIPDCSVIQIQRPDRTSLARCEYIDDYHFRLNNEVYHICQFAELMEKQGAVTTPEPISNADHGSWEIAGKGYLLLRDDGSGWNYTLLDNARQPLAQGKLDDPELSLNEAREEVLKSFKLQYRSRVPIGTDLLRDPAQQEQKVFATEPEKAPAVKKLRARSQKSRGGMER